LSHQDLTSIYSANRRRQISRSYQSLCQRGKCGDAGGHWYDNIHAGVINSVGRRRKGTKAPHLWGAAENGPRSKLGDAMCSTENARRKIADFSQPSHHRYVDGFFQSHSPNGQESGDGQ
jgi:hypothetical protein